MNLLLLDTGDAADAHWDDGLRAGRELMARYAVQMTFETPNQREPLKSTHRLLGRAGSIRLLGGDGRLAVSAAGVSAESAADAAMTVVRMVNSHWPKSRGPLIMRAWTAHRERVLLGRRGGGTRWSSSRPFDDGGDADGSAGVREPRRPLPGPGSLHAAADLPGPPS